MAVCVLVYVSLCVYRYVSVFVCYVCFDLSCSVLSFVLSCVFCSVVSENRTRGDSSAGGPNDVLRSSEDDGADSRQGGADDDDRSATKMIGKHAPNVAAEKSADEIGRRHVTSVLS